MIEILGGLWGLRKFLKGKKPAETSESNNEVTLTNSDGNQIIVNKPTYNIFVGNNAIDNSTQKIFQALESDPKVRGIEIRGEVGETLMRVNQDEFENISIPNDIFNVLNREVPHDNVRCMCLKVAFEKKYKWQVIYDDKPISVRITAEEFIDKVDRGEKFAKGDVLVCDMMISQIYDQDIDMWLDKSFVITKVHEHIIAKPQGTLGI